MIFYDQPNPKGLQFLSLDPLELDISASNTIVSKKQKCDSLEQIIHCSHQLNHEGKDPVSANLEMVLIQVYTNHTIFLSREFIFKIKKID